MGSSIIYKYGQSFCGGFLVGYQYVVTAAHCVNGRSTSVLTVYAGIQPLSQRNTTGQSRNVSIITVHPSYTVIGIYKRCSSTDTSVTI
jgi:secreted trypsin-like serine protease